VDHIFERHFDDIHHLAVIALSDRNDPRHRFEFAVRIGKLLRE